MVASKICAVSTAIMSAVAASSIPRHDVSGHAADPIVHLDNGLSVQGRLAPAASTVAEFLGIPTILMGFGLPDDGLHSPNED